MSVESARVLAEVTRIVDEIFNKRKPGWRMSIPARPGYDSDLVIAEGVRALEAENARLAKRVEVLENVGRASRDDITDQLADRFPDLGPGLAREMANWIVDNTSD